MVGIGIADETDDVEFGPTVKKDVETREGAVGNPQKKYACGVVGVKHDL
jgi:hypothetical protein